VRSAAAVITQKTRAAATDAKNILSLTIRFFSIVSFALSLFCMHACACWGQIQQLFLSRNSSPLVDIVWEKMAHKDGYLLMDVMHCNNNNKRKFLCILTKQAIGCSKLGEF
jgi:hypothetical protein